MIIGTLSVLERNGELRLEAPVTLRGETRTCFYSVPVEYADLVETELNNSLALSLVLPAMMEGEPIRVEGKMSERLFFQIRDELIPIMTAFNPGYRTVDFTAEELSSEQYSPGVQRGVGTGLSGGIDSSLCIRNHFVLPVSERYRLTHLFFFNVGSHGMAPDEERLKAVERKFRTRFLAMKPCADELGLPLVPVNSNVHSFFRIGHLESCSFVTPGAALLMQKKIGRYYLASGGHDFQDKYHRLVDCRERGDAAEIDPLLIPYMSTENLLLETTETRLNRLQKTELIADFPIARKYLNVCCNYDAMEANCSCCEKCACTLTMLDLLGKIDNFSDVFDIETYRKKARKTFLAEVFAKKKEDPFYRSIVEYARKHGIGLLHDTTLTAIFWEWFCNSRIHNFLRSLPGLRPAIRTLKRLAGR